VIRAELHLDAEAVLWQEMTAWQEVTVREVTVRQETAMWWSPCSSVPSSSLYLPNRVPCLPLSRLTSGSEPELLNSTKLCPLSSSQDSTSIFYQNASFGQFHMVFSKYLQLWNILCILFIIS